MTDLHKTDTSAVVNILDEILEENLEDLGGGEDTGTKKALVRRRSQRTVSPATKTNSSAAATVTRVTRRGSRRGSQSLTNSGGLTLNQSPQTEVAADDEFCSRPVSANTSSSTNDELNSTASSLENALLDITAKKEEIDKTKNHKSEEKMASQDNREDLFKEKLSASREESNLNHDKNFDDTRSNVSSSDDEDGTSQISNHSLSSASFSSDSEVDKKPEETVKAQANPSQQNSDDDKPEKPDKKDLSTRLNYILRDARFFLMKSNNIENIELSKAKNVWSTPPTNESKINQSLKEARNVLLLFSVKESGKFSGFARLGSESNRGGPQVEWILPPGLTQRALGGVFSVDWISKHDLPFTKTQHLFNPWNDGKPVKIGRDGQEVEPHVASELCKLFPMDSTTDWNRVLRRSKESVKTVDQTRVVGPIGSNTSSSVGSRGRGGFRDNRRDARGRFPSSHQSNTTRSFDYGRGARRRFGDEEYTPRPKRSRGAVYDSYGGNYSDRRYELSSAQRYTRDRSYITSRKNSAQLYSDYAVRDYHHRPPPVAPLPYPPPPPFDSLPPLPRYYDGPPLPEFPSTSRSSARNQRSTSPYEKSITDFLRRTDDRRERDRTRGRDHGRKYHHRR